MKIMNWIFGIFALLILVVFLGKYAVSIGSLPLWIIIVGVLVLPVADFWLTVKDSNKSEESGGSSSADA